MRVLNARVNFEFLFFRFFILKTLFYSLLGYVIIFEAKNYQFAY